MDLRTRAAERLYAALTADEPFSRLRDSVKDLVAAGHTRDEVYAELESIRRELRDEDREDEEDLIMEVMDLLVGWCAPGQRI